MELKSKLVFLNLIIRKHLTQAIQKWRYNTSINHLVQKYQKLKQYTSKILKSRQVPDIRILTAKNQEENRSRKSSAERTGFDSTKSAHLTKTQIYRSISTNKKLIKKPPKPDSKIQNSENLSSLYSTKHFSSAPSEEIAVVSSHLDITPLSLNIPKEKSNSYFKIR